MWCSYHKTTPHNDTDCRTTPANGLNGNAHIAQVRPPSVPGIGSPLDLPVRDDFDEKPCISFLTGEVQPAAKPAKARVEEDKGAQSFGPVQTAATEEWRTRPWPFTPRVELQPATKPTKALVKAEKGAQPFGPVSTAATEGWRTRPWPFTPRAEQAISVGGPVGEETVGMANDEELRRRSPLHPRTAPTVTAPPLRHQRNLCPGSDGNLCQEEHQRFCQRGHQRLCQGKHQRLCQGEHQRLCQGEHQRLCQGEHQRLCQGEHQHLCPGSINA